MTKTNAAKLGLSYKRDGSLWDGGSGKWVVKYDYVEVEAQLKVAIDNGQALACKPPYGSGNKPSVYGSREEARQAFLTLPADVRSERRWRIAELDHSELAAIVTV